MSNIWIKARIPNGSRLEVAVRGATPADDARFAARAWLVRQDHSEVEIPDASIHRGPRIEGPIRTGDRWAMRVAVFFAGSASAEIVALVRKPNGALYGNFFRYRFQGTNGDVVRATLILGA